MPKKPPKKRTSARSILPLAPGDSSLTASFMEIAVALAEIERAHQDAGHLAEVRRAQQASRHLQRAWELATDLEKGATA
jgi:uncharacterized protein YmfQ (DUF2313 family)